jgi:hypothetical protein
MGRQPEGGIRFDLGRVRGLSTFPRNGTRITNGKVIGMTHEK